MVRFKNRYMVFELEWKHDSGSAGLNELKLLQVFRQAVQDLHGEALLGLVLASLQVKYYNPLQHLCVVRCGRDDHTKVWAALTCLTAIKNEPVAIRLVHLTGDVNACKALMLKTLPEDDGAGPNAKIFAQARLNIEAMEV
uniref:Ribonuclease P/MRP protein subunit POP5 n=1 Tax=Auxenochlorella protothecoides TaxID=3075 RepID=A0A1D2A228_AUXPR